MIKYYDKYGSELKYKDFIELQWDRKYNECGSFVLYMAAKDYDPNIMYIKNVGRPETGIVQKLHLEQKKEGDFITLSGFFIEKLAEWGSQCWDYGYGVGRTTPASHSATRLSLLQILYSTFSQYAYKENFFGVDNLNPPLDNNIYCTTVNDSSNFPPFLGIWIEAGVSTGKAFYDYCNQDNYTYGCTPIFNDKSKEAIEPLIGLDFRFWKGRDLTSEIYFGKAWGDVSKISYTLDESANRCSYVAMQQIEKPAGFTGVYNIPTPDGVKNYISEYMLSEANMPSNLGKIHPVKVINTNVSGIEMTSANEVAIRNEMRKQATLDMLNNYRVENISIDVIQNRFLYLKDYDIGDVCSIVIDEIEQLYTARIVEVHEVHSSNKVDVQIVLGTPQKQKYVRRY